jgi:hypothetical protein
MIEQLNGAIGLEQAHASGGSCRFEVMRDGHVIYSPNR